MMGLAVQFQGDVSLGNVIVALSVGIPLLLLLLQYGKSGSQTVQVLQIRADTLERDLEDAKAALVALQAKNDALVDAGHQSELAIKDREREIAELKARPDTQKMLDAFEMNQAAVLRVLGDLSKGLETVIELVQSGRNES